MFKTKKALGQNFLINKNIALAEAAHAMDKVVLEIGPGKGILTQELCNTAKKVIAVEKDTTLYGMLGSKFQFDNLILINKDFFDCTPQELDLEHVDIVISNIPYNLSSKTISWLYKNKKEAVLCLQREFVDHLLAKEDTHNYSRLSVMSHILFRIVELMKVPRGNFVPKPKVDSEIIFIKPKDFSITKFQENAINLIMQHKKKTLKNAILDSEEGLGINKQKLLSALEKLDISSQRVFKLAPMKILEVTKILEKLQK